MFEEKQHLAIPGPTPVPPGVLRATGRPMISHRGEAFHNLLTRVTEGAKQVFQTSNDVLLLTASGTGGLEAAVTNVVSPGDKVIVATIGYFGDRVRDICERWGLNVVRVDSEWGKPTDPEALGAALRQHPDARAVFITHNETSTGVENDLKAIAEVVKGHEALLVVDAISSLGAVNIETDNWGIDMVVTASQKALMAPPGLSLISVSGRAWHIMDGAKSPRFYFDLKKARSSAEKSETPYTPAVSFLYSLEESLGMILKEGLQPIFDRHTLMARMVRTGVKALGLGLLVEDEYGSRTVTAVKVPEGIDGGKLRSILRGYGVVASDGQGQLKGKIFRLAHMGYTTVLDILGMVSALEVALTRMGYPTELGAGIKAIEQVMLG